jgi:ABC-type arginine/histidine transport system permease subunit
MGEAQLISSRTYKPIQVFVIAGIIYYILTLVITRIFGFLERRYNRYVTVAR